MKRPVLTILGLTVLMFCALFPLRESTYRTIFQARDLDRARLILEGETILYGPEISFGGNTPGPFYYYLLAVPLKLGANLFAIDVFKYSLSALGLALLAWIVFLESGLGGIFIFLALIMGLEGVSDYLQYDWNGSYLILFSALALYALRKIFDPKAIYPGRLWLGLCLMLSLTAQIHLSVLAFVLAGVTLQIFAPRLELKRLTGGSFASGLLLFALPLLPFIWWVNYGDSMDRKPATLSFSTDQYGYFANYEKLLLRALPVTDPGNPNKPDSLALLQQLRDRFLEREPILTLTVLFILILWLLQRESRTSRPEPRRWSASFKALLWTSATVISVALPSLITGRFNRYLIHFNLCLAILLSICLYQLALPWFQKRREYYFLLLMLIPIGAGYFLDKRGSLNICLASGILTLLLSLRLLKSPWRASVATALGCATILLMGQIVGADYKSWAAYYPLPGKSIGALLSQDPIQRVCNILVTQDGWDLERLKRSLFVVNTNPETDFMEVCAETPRGPNVGRNQGYFLVAPTQDMHDPKNANWSSYLLDQKLPSIVAKGIANKVIELGQAIEVNHVFLIPYNIKDPNFPIRQIHNLGSPYHSATQGYSLDGLELSPLSNGVIKLGQEHWLFYWNNCKSTKELNCRNGIYVQRSSLGVWNIDIVGTPISQRYDWLNPNRAESWKGVHMRLTCGKDRFEIPLVDQVGNLDVHRRQKYLLAPLQLRIQDPCHQAISKIEVGYDKSDVWGTRVTSEEGPSYLETADNK